jgi:ribosomal protein S15P/S13E
MIVKTNRLSKKLSGFMAGRDGVSLEKNIYALYEDNKILKEHMTKHRKDIQTLFKKHESAFQKMGLVKYDAFHQMGGQLSFSLALLDEKDNGFIINSVHSTDGCYSYTKRITAGECKLALGKEEEEALTRAKSNKD